MYRKRYRGVFGSAPKMTRREDKTRRGRQHCSFVLSPSLPTPSWVVLAHALWRICCSWCVLSYSYTTGGAIRVYLLYHSVILCARGRHPEIERERKTHNFQNSVILSNPSSSKSNIVSRIIIV